MTAASVFVSSLDEIVLIEGSLFRNNESELLRYWPIEASKYMMRILVDEEISTNETLWIKNKAIKIKLQVDQVSKNFRNSDFHLISLSSVTLTGSLDAILHSSSEVARHTGGEELKPHIANSKLAIRAPRFCPAPPVFIEAKTFGSIDIFKFKTVDLSKSGMLVTETDEQAPFIIHTIVELTIDPSGIVFEAPLNCLGKIVRKDRSELKAKFGIQLIDLTPSLLKTWEFYIAGLERPNPENKKISIK